MVNSVISTECEGRVQATDNKVYLPAFQQPLNFKILLTTTSLLFQAMKLWKIENFTN